MSPQYYFYNLMMLFLTFILWKICRYPVEKYFHWDDPLKEEEQGSKNYLEKIKYKSKVKDWQSVWSYNH